MSRVYDTQRWKRVRANQLNREPTCRMCRELGMSVPRPAQHVDHITPLAAGGAPYDRANLMSLCHSHHSWKTDTLDKTGIAYSEWKVRGCYLDGSPRDPSHPWYKGPPANH